MLAPRKHHLLRVTEEEFKNVRAIYNLTKESLDRDIDGLIEWYDKQPHLPKIELDRDVIERYYIINKCSMERTKQRLDMRFTSKVILPEWFYGRDPQSNSIQTCFGAIVSAPMRHLMPDRSRLNIIRILDPNPEVFNAVDFFRLIFMFGEIRLNYDYSVGDQILIDLQGATLGHFFKINPIVISKSDITNKKVFGSKLNGIHILNGNIFLEKFVSILKQSLKGKMAERIFSHGSLDDLHEHIPKRILPKDYGGSEKSYLEIVGDWQEEFHNEKLQNYFAEQDKYMSDESKRSQDKFLDEMLGMPGSFKQLVLD